MTRSGPNAWRGAVPRAAGWFSKPTTSHVQKRKYAIRLHPLSRREDARPPSQGRCDNLMLTRMLERGKAVLRYRPIGLAGEAALRCFAREFPARVHYFVLMAAIQNTIGIVYDYDQTLSPAYMQDDVIFPAFGINAEKFWRRCAELVQEQGYDQELAYMKCLLDYLAVDRPTNKLLQQLGAKMSLYRGLPEMFAEFQEGLLTSEQLEAGIRVEHYVVSSGLKVLIEGSRIRPYLRAVFGCEYAEDAEGRIAFPKRVISHTQKTQYLFRINKGLLDMSQDVNDHMPDNVRPIPFPNMIYIGDGPTDVPCFTIMKKNGGHAIAVYNPDDPGRASFRKCFDLATRAERVRHIAPADYRQNSHLRLLLEEMVREVTDRILAERKASAEAGVVHAPRHLV
jgi:hypothetical protein